MDTRRLGTRLISQKFASFSAVVLASLILASTTSFAAEDKSYRYGLSGNNLVFTTVEEAVVGGSFRLSVKDGKPGKISVELVDIVANSSGSKSPIPLNSSPFTPFELVSFTKDYPAYKPSEEYQYFEISMKFKEGIDPDRPVLGGLSISLIPDEQSKNDVIVASSIVATFAYIPASGINLEEYAPELGLIGPNIGRENPDFFPLNLFPNLPFLPNHGDLLLGYELENTGKIFLETKTKVEVDQLNLLGWSEAEVFTQTNEAFLVPGQKTQSTVEIAPPDLPHQQLGIGIYRFTTTSSGDMGDQIDVSTSSQQTLVIFPWKQGVIALLLLVLFRRRVFRSFNWVLGYARALRDFRYNPTPQTPTQVAPTVGVGNAFRAEAKVQPETAAETKIQPEPFRALSKRELFKAKPGANPNSPSNKQWKLPKLKLPSIPKFKLPKIQFPKLEIPKLNLSAVSKALLGALPKPKPKPASSKTPPAPPAPRSETPLAFPKQTQKKSGPWTPQPVMPATPKPSRLNINPTDVGKSSSSPGTRTPSSAPRPLYPYWYQPPKKDGSS